MTTRALNQNGDLGPGGTFFAFGSAEAVAQNIRTRLKLFLGEYFLDIREGTPWFDGNNVKGILGKRGNLAQKEAAIKRRILLAPGLSQMTSFEMDFDLAERRLSIKAGIISLSGEPADIEFIQVI